MKQSVTIQDAEETARVLAGNGIAVLLLKELRPTPFVSFACRVKADILLANDPDADRLGMVVLHRGEPVILTGNQIASICVEYLCHHLQESGRLKPTCAFITTIVSTELIGQIAKAWKSASPLPTGSKSPRDPRRTQANHLIYSLDVIYPMLEKLLRPRPSNSLLFADKMDDVLYCSRNI